jgi:non-canonical purine NTP pyrophosphatase (RdgB/HAM1 family)
LTPSPLSQPEAQGPTGSPASSTSTSSSTAGGVRVFQGTVSGTLAAEPRGTSGFGYDSIFIPDSDPSQRTYAQMTSDEKNKISHRRRAVEAMRNALDIR